jgi:hypothetical protein
MLPLIVLYFGLSSCCLASTTRLIRSTTLKGASRAGTSMPLPVSATSGAQAAVSVHVNDARQQCTCGDAEQ